VRREDEDEDERAFRALRREVSVHPGKVVSKRTKETFVQVPLWWAEQVCRATRTPKAFVWIWLLHLAWKAKSNSFAVPNGQLSKSGVHRNTKERVLRELEKAGLIKVERKPRQTPIVTLIVR
jgi:hypothetical protein